jgi:hypothetical protein
MTVQKIYILICNGCRQVIPSGLDTDDLVTMEDKPDSITFVRTLAASLGWRHTASGKDLCPACQEIKRTPAKPGLLSHIPHPHWGHR